MPVISNQQALLPAWNQLSVPDTIYDEYAFRMAFFDESQNELFCFVDNLDKPSALLPLARNKEAHELRFIGTPFLERNRGFCVSGYESVLTELYEKISCTYSCILDDIATTDPITQTHSVTQDESSYVYDFAKHNISSITDINQTVSTRLSERLITARSYIDHAVSIETVSLNKTIDAIRTISFERFGSDSWLENNTINQEVRKLPNIKTNYPITVVPRLLIAENGLCVGGHIGIVHNNTYYTLFSSARYLESLPEIGTLVHLTGFKLALEANCKYLDTGLGDCGWKSRWGLEATPQYKFIK